jgi:hypothetical protein
VKVPSLLGDFGVAVFATKANELWGYTWYEITGKSRFASRMITYLVEVNN